MKKISQINLAPEGGFRGPGPLNPVSEGHAVGVLTRVLSITVGFLSVVASIYFMFKVITGGLSIISAGGDKGKVAEARISITNGLIGLLVVLLGTIFVGFIGTIIGIDILNIQSLLVDELPN
ncbi:hypothetical protein JXA63_02315 [Candidatus Woesebacteria bacterium]|nr:hypothetical protein [Candidatus Woesebacteria bacterium]